MTSVESHPASGSECDAINEKPGLTHTVSAGGISLSPELFEKLYLTPKVPHAGDNIKRYANPTPLGFLGFVISTFTFAMVIMGWGGAAGLSPVVGIFFFVGPVLLILATIFEWIMGNFFPMMICGLFAVFWLSFGMLQLPTLGLAAPYSTDGTDAVAGAATKEFNAVIAIYLIVWGFAIFTFWIFTLKTNIVFCVKLLLASTAAFVLSGSYWKLSTGDYDQALKLQKVGGAILFVVSCLAWYLIIVMMAAEMRFPIKLPVGDLSHFWPRTDVEMGKAEKEV